jgi:hypothetical protein
MKPALIALAVFTLACRSVYVDYPSPDSSRVDLAKPREISSRRCGFQLLLVIPIGVNGRLDRAWSDLRRLAAHDVIGDVSQQESWFYAWIGTLYCSKLVANAYPKVEPEPEPAAAP